MVDLANILKDTGPYFIAAFVILVLGRQYLIVRAKEADATVIAAQHEKETAKYQSEAEIRRDAKDEKIALELAQYRATQTANVAASAQALQQNTEIAGQTVAALATMATKQSTVQSAVTDAVSQSETRIVASVESSRDKVISVLSKMGEFNNEVFKPVAAKPPNLDAMEQILNTALAAIKDVQRHQMEDAALPINAPIPPAPPPTLPKADAPAEVVVADISPQAVASIMDAVAKTDAGDEGATAA